MNLNKLQLYFLVLTFICFTNLHAQDKNYRASLTRNLILSEFYKHPKIEIQDLYKLLHQSNLGSEHAVLNKEGVVTWMKNEIANLDWKNDDNLIDTISVDAKIVRINLRPFIKLGYSSENLINAFIKTANNYHGSKQNMKTDLQILISLVKEKILPYDINKLINFISEMEQQGYPAVHHSDVYVKEYSPAYRVVSSEYLDELLKK